MASLNGPKRAAWACTALTMLALAGGAPPAGAWPYVPGVRGGHATAAPPSGASAILSYLKNSIALDNVSQTLIEAQSTGSPYYQPSPAVIYGVAPIYTGAYNATTGLVTLTVDSQTWLAPGSVSTVAGLTGTNASAANGTFTLQAGTVGQSVNGTVTTSTTATYYASGCSAPGVSNAGCPTSMTINPANGPVSGTITTPDFANMTSAGITAVRIPVDVEQILTGLPFPTSYLHTMTLGAGSSYNSSTGLVTMNLASAVNLAPTYSWTAYSAASIGAGTIVLNSVTPTVGATVSDTTHSGAIPGGTTVTAASVSTSTGLVTVTLSNTVASPGVSAGDTLAFGTIATVTGGAGTCTGTCTVSPTATAAYTATNSIGISSAYAVKNGATITDLTNSGAIPGGTTVTGVSGTTLTLSNNVTSMGSGDVLSITTSIGNLLNGSQLAGSGTNGTTLTYSLPAGLNIVSITGATLSNIWTELPSSYTQMPASYGTPLNGTAGCALTYVSTACTVAYDLQILDTTIANLTAAGFAVDVVPFVAPSPAGAAPDITTGGASPSGDLHNDMGASLACFGYSAISTSGGTCFEGMLEAADLFLLNRYVTTLGYTPAQFVLELYNEPDYKAPGQGQEPWQSYTAYTNLTDNGFIQDVTNKIRAIDTTHFLVIDGFSAAKAQWFSNLTPVTDATGREIYSVHKYDPVYLVNSSSGANWNPYYIYPRESTGGTAIGRPGGIAPAYIPYPAPAQNTPVGSAVSNTGAACGSGGTPPAWPSNATTALTGAGQKVACISGAIGNATKYFDYFKSTTGTDNPEYTASDLLNNVSDGLSMAINWACGTACGVRTGAPLMLDVGEWGSTSEADYRSRLQVEQDLVNLFNTTGVPGGQTYLPHDIWAFSGVKFGIRPKSGGDNPPLSGAQGANCLGTSGVLKGYDLDVWAIITLPATQLAAPNCTAANGSQYATPGLP